MSILPPLTGHVRLFDFNANGPVTCCTGWSCCSEGAGIVKGNKEASREPVAPQNSGMTREEEDSEVEKIPHQYTLRLDPAKRKLVALPKESYRTREQIALDQQSWAVVKKSLLEDFSYVTEEEIDAYCQTLKKKSSETRLSVQRYLLLLGFVKIQNGLRQKSAQAERKLQEELTSKEGRLERLQRELAEKQQEMERLQKERDEKERQLASVQRKASAAEEKLQQQFVQRAAEIRRDSLGRERLMLRELTTHPVSSVAEKWRKEVEQAEAAETPSSAQQGDRPIVDWVRASSTEERPFSDPPNGNDLAGAGDSHSKKSGGSSEEDTHLLSSTAVTVTKAIVDEIANRTQPPSVRQSQ